MMNWKVGDRALFVSVRGDSTYPELYGQSCELIYFTSNCDGMSRAWECAFADRTTKVNELCLRPIPDDDHKRFHKALISSQWSDCEFNPMVEIEQ